MPLRPIHRVGFTACLALSLAGCGQGSKEKAAQANVPDWLSSSPQRSNTAAEPAVGTILALNLKLGTQFPLRKVVEQELRQNALSGEARADRSRLEVMFAITVQAQDGDRSQLAVRYDRVRYQHDVAEEHVEFDSLTPPANVAVGLRAYQDMVGDGFSFWIGKDNQISEVIGLKEFVDRTLRRVPMEQRAGVMLGIEAGSGETGIGNFVDNTIGLLPYGKPAVPGDTWQRQQHLMAPVPMTANNTYILKEVDDKLAVIDIRGSIIPSTNVNAMRNGDGVQVSVDGGTTMGSCSIFRETGLPRESRVTRTVDMTVQLQNTIKFKQVKRVITLIESYPAAPAPATVIGATGELDSALVNRR